MKKNQGKQQVSKTDKRPPIQAILEIEAQHPDEWIVVEITKMDDDGFTPSKGRLMAHGKNRDEVHQKAMQYQENYDIHHIYRNYTGEMRVESVLL